MMRTGHEGGRRKRALLNASPSGSRVRARSKKKEIYFGVQKGLTKICSRNIVSAASWTRLAVISLGATF